MKEKVANAKPGEVVSVDSLTFRKKPGRPPLLGKLFDQQLQAKILSMRSQQAVVNSSVVVSIARALLLKNNKLLLDDFGGPITLQKDWARHFLKQMGFSNFNI